jgi:hypothetical protein
MRLMCFPIDQPTADFVNVFDTFADVAADPKWGRRLSVTTRPAAAR